jgi:hypothetical protein
MIALAVVSLRDSVSGAIRTRRLLSIDSAGGDTRVTQRRSDVVGPVMVQSGPADSAAALTLLRNQPVNSNLPAMSFNVDVPQTIASIYGIPPGRVWAGVDIEVSIQTGETDIPKIRLMMTTLLLNNTRLICPTCDELYPAFQNIIRAVSAPVGRRQLKQVYQLSTYTAKYYLLMTFDGPVNPKYPPC